MAGFRSSSSNSTNTTGTSLTITAPSGVTSGDLLIAAITFRGSGFPTCTAPSGWNVLLADGPASGEWMSVFTKVATASEPASYTFTWNTSSYAICGGILDYEGLDLDTYAIAVSNPQAGTFTAPNVGTTQASELLVGIWYCDNGGYALASPPAGLSTHVNAYPSSGGPTLLMGDVPGPSTPGSANPGTATDSTYAAYWVGVTFALLIPLPLAPTLTAPVNAAYSDLAVNGGPFAWTFNKGYSGSTGQSAYAFRRKTTGAYSYWNASTSSWQSSIVWNTSTAQSLTFSASKWTDGTTYNWSVATEDNYGQGSFASDFTVTATSTPTLSVSAPSGTVDTTNTPTVTWSGGYGSGYSQGTYRVVTYSAAQYSAVGFTPGSGPSADDSGVVTSATTSYVIATPLTNSVNYRSYVQVTETPGGLPSAWAYSAFTLSLNAPAPPTVTAIVTTDGTTGCPMIQLAVQAHDNLLTANQSNLENGNTTGWSPLANTSTTLLADNSWAADGFYSMRMTNGTTGSTIGASTPTGVLGFEVEPNTSYTAMATFHARSTAYASRTCAIEIQFYDSSGNQVWLSKGSSISVANGPGRFAMDPNGVYAYVCQEDSAGFVSAIEVATNTVVNTVQVGSVPLGLAITPDGKTLYASCAGASQVTPIDTATFTAGTPISVTNTPGDIAITPDETMAYLVNETGNTVTPITLATQAVGTLINVGNTPVGIAITPDGTKAYVTNYYGNNVTPIDLTTNTPGTTISVGSNPYGIAITPDGKTAYVCNSGDNTVTPITVASNTAGTPIAVGNVPITIKITPDGHWAMVACQNSNALYTIQVDSNTVGASVGVDTLPIGVGITPNGTKTFVGCKTAETVVPVDTLDPIAGVVASTTSGGALAYGNITSPSNAAYAALQPVVYGVSTSEAHDVDTLSLFPAYSSNGVPVWTAGGFAGISGASLLRSDGMYVRNASLLSPLSIPIPSQSASVNDYEVPTYAEYTYTGIVQATVGGITLYSASSTASAQVEIQSTNWWELDPTDPTTAINAQATAWQPVVTEQSTAHLVMGQEYPSVIANAMGGQDGSATFSTFTAAIYAGLQALLQSQKTVFVSSPFGSVDCGYVRFGPQTGGMSTGNGNKVKDSSLNASTAAAPYRTVQVTFVSQPRPDV